MDRPLPRGKLPAPDLARLLASLTGDPSVIVGPDPGEDAAVLALPAEAMLVAAADPITFPTPRPGWYAVHVNANDVATRGGVPRWFLATLILPAGSTADAIQRLLHDVISACTEVGALLVGGHTEISEAATLPIVAGCMLGTVTSDRLRRTGGGQSGDDLILAGYVGVEGTSILAASAAVPLRRAGWSESEIAAAAALVDRLGISVLPAAAQAGSLAHALHDLTEGGLATAVAELARASRTGAVLDTSTVVPRPETMALCTALDLDPLGLLSSGCLLIAAPPIATPALLRRLHAAGTATALCGHLTPAGTGLHQVQGGTVRSLPEFPRDELARWLEEHHAT